MQKLAILLISLIISHALYAGEVPSRPEGIVQPTSEQYLSIRNDINTQKYETALQKLQDHIPSTINEDLWNNFYRSLISIAKNNDSEAFGFLSNNLELEKYGSINTDLGKRILIQSLKKLGFIYRRNDMLENAISTHKTQMEYSILFGSFEELHDNAISLDNDYYLASNYQESINWLKISLNYAGKIKSNLSKYRSLGISYNNLALTSLELKSYSEGHSCAKSSLENYEKLYIEDESQTHKQMYNSAIKLNISILEKWNSVLDQNSDQRLHNLNLVKSLKALLK